jgi:integrase
VNHAKKTAFKSCRPDQFCTVKRGLKVPALSSRLSSGERTAAALEAIASALQSLAAAFTANSLPAPGLPPSLSNTHAHGLGLVECVNDFVIAKAKQGRSDRYLRQFRVALSSFAKGRAKAPLASISTDDVEAWLRDSGWSVRTQRGYVADVRTFFAWCVRRSLLERNPADAVDLPAAEASVVALHTPDQVMDVLEAARSRDLQVLRHLALCYFAGVRSAEAHRLREEDLRSGFVHVPATKAKTRSRRVIRISEALQAWLDLGGELGPMSPNRVRAVIRASRVPWAHNVARHSFVSYHLAAGQNAAATALEAGHSEAILFRHYRELVTPDQAREFWALRPR